MKPFSIELLTILVLISIILTGITFLTILIIIIFKLCIKRNHSKSIKPIRTPSIISIEHHSSTITPVPIKNNDQNKKSKHNYDTHSIIDEHPYSNNKNQYQQQEYIHDENDETTSTTRNESRMFIQRQQKRQYQQIKPLADIRIMDRHTPYPADVLAREKLMNNTRFSTDNKY